MVPALIAGLGEHAAWRYIEFFTRQYPQPEHAASLCTRVSSHGATAVD
jgi:hypothetical protein